MLQHFQKCRIIGEIFVCDSARSGELVNLRIWNLESKN